MTHGERTGISEEQARESEDADRHARMGPRSTPEREQAWSQGYIAKAGCRNRSFGGEESGKEASNKSVMPTRRPVSLIRACTKCGVEKPLSEFHKQKKSSDGHRPECKVCCNRRNHRYYAANREKITARGREYNKTEHRRDYSRNYARRWLRAQRDRSATRPRPATCEVCGRHSADALGRAIVFDHDHITGQFRGWLCNRCNRVIGLCRDDPAILLSLVRYLQNVVNRKGA